MKVFDMGATFANPSNAPDITIESIRKSIENLTVSYTPIERTLMGMTLRESPYLPAGVSMMTGHDSFALIYHATGKVVAFKRPNRFSPWKREGDQHP